MKQLTLTLIAIVVFFAGGIAAAQQQAVQEPAPTFEKLRPYGPFLGNWRYEGPLMEDFPGTAKKDDRIVFEFSWRRILNKAAVEESWSFELPGKKFSGKAMIGWDAQRQRLIYGGLNSEGGMEVGTVEFDPGAKTSTLTSSIISEKETESFKGVVTKTGTDTITWKALERSGGIVEGPSPEYTFKRVSRPKRAAPK